MPRRFLNIFCGNRGPPTLHFVPVGTPIPTLDSLGRDSDLSEANVGTEALAERRSRPRIRCEYSIFERRDCQTLVKEMSTLRLHPPKPHENPRISTFAKLPPPNFHTAKLPQPKYMAKLTG